MEQIHITEQVKAHFLRLYQMALCDDDFSELELKMLYQLAEERSIPKTELDKILLSPINTNVVLPQTMQEKVSYLYDLTKVVWADGIVDENERTTLEKYIRLFGFLEENIKGIADYFLEAVHNGKTREEILQEII